MIKYILGIYVPDKVNPAAVVYNRDPSDQTEDSDNNNSFQHHSDIILALNMVEI